MQLEIPWETIFKLILAGAFTFVIAPGLLVLRDLLLWKIIEKFVITNKLQIDMEVWASAQWMLANYLTKRPGFSLSKDGVPTEYMLDGQPVSEDAFDKYINKRRSYEDKVVKLGPRIQFKINLVRWLLKHYKQESESNPVQELLDATVARAEESGERMKAIAAKKQG